MQSTRWYRRLQVKLRRKSVRKKIMRATLLLSNIAILAAVLSFILLSRPASSSSNTLSVGDLAAATSSTNNAAATVNDPLDQLSSADIALTVARMTSLPETTAINNQADTQDAELAMAATSDTVTSKPQVVATALKSRADIQYYVTQPGDTVTTIASKFGVTSNSIMWSNSLRTNTVTAGQRLVIPPVNGIVYTVKSGDTPASLAQRYSASESQIIAYNDAEISGLQVGEVIIIPGGTQPAAPVQTASASSGAFPWGSGPVYGSNGYDFGYCTWYVASRIAVPNNWGNASSWAYYARLSGWTVSSIPVPGAIAQTPYAAGGEGHVAIVEAVSADGSEIKYSDMNGLAGWDRVGYSGWVSASTFPNYIYH